MQLELLYRSQTFEPHLTVYQEDLRRVGIMLNLRLITPETQFQMVNERRFQMANMAWGGLLFPNPETSWHSRLADVENTNNITGFKSERVDELLEEYDLMFDPGDRERVIRKSTGFWPDSYQYILLWSAPFTRVVYWNNSERRRDTSRGSATTAPCGRCGGSSRKTSGSCKRRGATDQHSSR